MQPIGNKTKHVARALNKQKASPTVTDSCLDLNTNAGTSSDNNIRRQNRTCAPFHLIAIAGIKMTLERVHTPSQVEHAILPAANVMFRYQQVTGIS